MSPDPSDQSIEPSPQSTVRRLLSALDRLIVLGFVSFVASLVGWVAQSGWMHCQNKAPACSQPAYDIGAMTATLMPVLTGITVATYAMIRVARGAPLGDRLPIMGCGAAVAWLFVGLTIAGRAASS